MIHLLLAQAQQVVPVPHSGMSQLEMMLIGAIVTAVTGVAGLITWIVKSAAPRVIAAFEKRNDALVSASEKTADAVSKIPEAIKSFEVALIGAEKRLVEEINESQEKIVKELHDNRISELSRLVHDQIAPRSSQPGSPPKG